MSAGVAIPLGVLLRVVAGVLLGARRPARTEAGAGTRAPSPPRQPVATMPAGRPAAADMPLATGGGICTYRVAGTSYRQETLSDLRADILRAPRRGAADRRRDAFVAELRPEPENPHDPHAVAVDAPGHGTVGWLAHGDGAQYIGLLRVVQDRGLPLRCPADVFKGTDGAFDVRLDLATPAAIAAKLQVDRRELAARETAAASLQGPPTLT
jgi:hypothetical protein